MHALKQEKNDNIEIFGTIPVENGLIVSKFMHVAMNKRIKQNKCVRSKTPTLEYKTLKRRDWLDADAMRLIGE